MPFLGNFPDCRVTGARHVAHDSVKLDTSIAPINTFIVKVGEVLGHVVDDNDVCGVESIHLMGQHESSFGVGIVGDDKALRYIGVRPLMLI